MVDGNIAIIVIFILAAITIGVIGHLQAKRRREAMQLIANQLGFRFSPKRDRSFANHFQFLTHMHRGSNRYAYNIMSGRSPDGGQAHIFDYHYQTTSGSGKSRHTHHHYFAIFTLTLPKFFPELNIEPEGFLSKIGQALGFDDIDFESVAFSNRYKVKSNDKKFAYDFCNARMIEFLMSQPDFIIEVEGNTLAMTFKGNLAVAMIPSQYQRLLHIRSLMPEYLFDS